MSASTDPAILNPTQSESEEQKWGNYIYASPQSSPILALDTDSKLTPEMAEPSPVPLQREYRGQKKVIPNHLADMTYTELGGALNVLRILETILGPVVETRKAELVPFVESCGSEGHDFGMIYALVRRFWSQTGSIVGAIATAKRRDAFMRADAVETMPDGQIVTNRNLPPRRVWDLLANRVVPYWASRTPNVTAISHSWVTQDESKTILKSPINRMEWSIIIPRSTTLERVRIEMLNLTLMEYAWLDVLCQRQALEGDVSPRWAKKMEQIRTQELKLDMPIMGGVYVSPSNSIVQYLSGLGRVFQFDENFHDAERNWVNRVWTLQESGDRAQPVFLGGSPLEPEGKMSAHDEGHMLQELRRVLGDELRSNPKAEQYFQRIVDLVHRPSVNERLITNVFYDLDCMMARYSRGALDKITGLLFLICGNSFPVYDSPQYDTNLAWEDCVKCLREENLKELFCIFPAAGNGDWHWFPSWQQIIAAKDKLGSLWDFRIFKQFQAPYAFKGTITYNSQFWILNGHCIRNVKVINKDPQNDQQPRDSVQTLEITGKNSVCTISTTSSCSDLDHVSNPMLVTVFNTKLHEQYWALGYESTASQTKVSRPVVHSQPLKWISPECYDDRLDYNEMIVTTFHKLAVVQLAYEQVEELNSHEPYLCFLA